MRFDMRAVDGHSFRPLNLIVPHNSEQGFARELASPAEALRAGLMMQARRGRLEIGDVLKVTAPN